MKNNDTIEKRYVANDNIVKLDTPESRHVEGYALVFGEQSVDLGFFETINRSAVSQELVDSCDVFALLNHDPDKVLARSNSSLKLTVDERGLKYEFDAPNTDLGNELLEHIRRGEIDSSSFAFTVDWNDKDAQKWERRDGANYRTINKINEILDVSPCFKAAYSATSVSTRAIDKLEELRSEEEKSIEEARKQEVMANLSLLKKEIEEMSI